LWDCHTPATPQGELEVTKWLKGVNGRISTASGALWANWKEKGFLSFLENGQAPSGQPVRHPMPPFKLRPDDAGAIEQYLKTLK
jgi:hypothetical protein